MTATAVVLLGLATVLSTARALSGPAALRSRARSLTALPARRRRLLRPGRSAGGAVGGPVPRTSVARRFSRRARRAAVDAALPETADLLVACVQAGLNLPLALRRVALHAPAPLRSELGRLNSEVALGRPLREALSALAERTGATDVRTLASILAGADRFGSRMGESLERWADDVWVRRRHEVEAEARRAPVRILFPLVLLILPAFLLTTVVPLLLSTLRTLGY